MTDNSVLRLVSSVSKFKISFCGKFFRSACLTQAMMEVLGGEGLSCWRRSRDQQVTVAIIVSHSRNFNQPHRDNEKRAEIFKLQMVISCRACPFTTRHERSG